MDSEDLEEKIFQLEIRQSRLREAVNDYNWSNEKDIRVMEELLHELQIQLLEHEIQAGHISLLAALVDPREGVRKAAQDIKRRTENGRS